MATIFPGHRATLYRIVSYLRTDNRLQLVRLSFTTLCFFMRLKEIGDCLSFSNKLTVKHYNRMIVARLQQYNAEDSGIETFTCSP